MPANPKLIRPGFSLIELLIVLMFFTLIGVMSAHFLVPVIGTMRGARAEAAANARMEVAVRAIRNDVWQAVSIESSPATQLRLTRADGSTRRWELEADHHLWQTGSPRDRHDFGIFPGSIQFDPQGAAVRLNLSGGPHVRGGVFTMVCPVLLEKP